MTLNEAKRTSGVVTTWQTHANTAFQLDRHCRNLANFCLGSVPAPSGPYRNARCTPSGKLRTVSIAYIDQRRDALSLCPLRFHSPIPGGKQHKIAEVTVRRGNQKRLVLEQSKNGHADGLAARVGLLGKRIQR